MNSRTISTNEIWNRFTVSSENQNNTNNTNTNELLNHIERRTRVMFIANLKFLFTINIIHNLNKICKFIDDSF